MHRLFIAKHFGRPVNFLFMTKLKKLIDLTNNLIVLDLFQYFR